MASKMKTLSAYVSEEMYFRIKFMAEDRGMNISVFLNQIISDYIYGNTVTELKENTASSKTGPKATENQLKYIDQLMGYLGRMPVDKTGLSFCEADEMIKTLKGELGWNKEVINAN